MSAATRLPERAYNIATLRRMAARRLPRMVFDFVDGGAEDERTLQRNEQDFAALEFLPQPLNGTATRDQSIELFGTRLKLPVLIGPTGLAGLLWPRGEIEAAHAAARAGTIYTMSHGSTVSIEDLANQVVGPKWFQVFLYKDRGLTQSFTERARAAGYQALVLTIDNQILGQRERDLANGFTIPPRFGLRTSANLLRRAGWLMAMSRAPRVTMANYVTDQRRDLLALAKHMPELLDPTLNWRDVDWLRSIWAGPLLLKGVLHPEEAALAVEHGIDGVIVSNHGGRQLESSISAIRALPAVAAAVAGRIPVLIDGGIRRGGDVVKALALGATACLIGRPHLWGLAVAGEAGVAHALEIFRADIDRVLALGGWDGLAAIDRQAVLLPGDWASLHPQDRQREAGSLRMFAKSDARVGSA